MGKGHSSQYKMKGEIQYVKEEQEHGEEGIAITGIHCLTSSYICVNRMDTGFHRDSSWYDLANNT